MCSTPSPPDMYQRPRSETDVQQAWRSARSRVVLLGDSTLDNVIWLRQGEPSITDQLRQTSGTDCGDQSGNTLAVYNFSADGFTSTDVLEGSSSVISMRTRDAAGSVDKIPWADDKNRQSRQTFYPLDRLAELDPPPTHVVLSVGGNDVRHILDSMGSLPQVVDTFANTNYPSIVKRCREICGPQLKLILVWQYRPCLSTDEHYYGVYRAMAAVPPLLPGAAGVRLSPVHKLNAVIELCYNSALEKVKSDGVLDFSGMGAGNVAIVDLPNSFDIHNDALYQSQIEPSCIGGSVIAMMIRHAMDIMPGDIQENTGPVAAGPWVVRCTTSDVISPLETCGELPELHVRRELSLPWRVTLHSEQDEVGFV